MFGEGEERIHLKKGWFLVIKLSFWLFLCDMMVVAGVDTNPLWQNHLITEFHWFLENHAHQHHLFFVASLGSLRIMHVSIIFFIALCNHANELMENLNHIRVGFGPSFKEREINLFSKSPSFMHCNLPFKTCIALVSNKKDGNLGGKERERVRLGVQRNWNCSINLHFVWSPKPQNCVKKFLNIVKLLAIGNGQS